MAELRDPVQALSDYLDAHCTGSTDCTAPHWVVGALEDTLAHVTALEAERDRLKNELYEISGIAENLVDVDIAQDQPAYAVSIMAQMLNEVRSTDAPASPPEGT